MHCINLRFTDLLTYTPYQPNAVLQPSCVTIKEADNWRRSNIPSLISTRNLNQHPHEPWRLYGCWVFWKLSPSIDMQSLFSESLNFTIYLSLEAVHHLHCALSDISRKMSSYVTFICSHDIRQSWWKAATNVSPLSQPQTITALQLILLPIHNTMMIWRDNNKHLRSNKTAQ